MNFKINIVLVIILVCIVLSIITINNQEIVKSKILNQKENVSGRERELQLEGFINDYFYRREIKDPEIFGTFKAYGSVLAKGIVVYVYPKSVLPNGAKDEISAMITKEIRQEILAFPDFEWARNYTFDVVIR